MHNSIDIRLSSTDPDCQYLLRAAYDGIARVAAFFARTPPPLAPDDLPCVVVVLLTQRDLPNLEALEVGFYSRRDEVATLTPLPSLDFPGALRALRGGDEYVSSDCLITERTADDADLLDGIARPLLVHLVVRPLTYGGRVEEFGAIDLDAVLRQLAGNN
jgi:hypothetical protein